MKGHMELQPIICKLTAEEVRNILLSYVQTQYPAFTVQKVDVRWDSSYTDPTDSRMDHDGTGLTGAEAVLVLK